MDGEEYDEPFPPIWEFCIRRLGLTDWLDCLFETGALDSGAHGVIVPLLYTPEDAKKLVQSAKFPPQGRRGFGSPFAMGSTGNVTAFEYLNQANDALLTIVQIETKEALDNVGSITANFDPYTIAGIHRGKFD